MLIERTDRTDRLGRILAADRRRLQKRMESGKATERDRRSLRIVEHLDECDLIDIDRRQLSVADDDTR